MSEKWHFIVKLIIEGGMSTANLSETPVQGLFEHKRLLFGICETLLNALFLLL